MGSTSEKTAYFLRVRGGGCLVKKSETVTKTKLRKELMSKIDSESLVMIEKVERYVGFWELYVKLQKAVMKNPIIVVKNGAQEYTKTNPAVNDLNKINTSLIALGKDMGIDAPAEMANSATSSARDELL